MTSTAEKVWVTIGFLGQGLFFMRWVMQWFKSEREGESTIPLSFWYLSLIGGLITLTYAIWRRDPVFIAGQSIGTLVYVRNLMLVYRNKTRLPLAGSSSASSRPSE
ncbi:MAG TPA: lipid-A-disaccharide synthase N-terminal domain-containing protein [Nitrospirales bacterium]